LVTSVIVQMIPYSYHNPLFCWIPRSRSKQNSKLENRPYDERRTLHNEGQCLANKIELDIKQPTNWDRKATKSKPHKTEWWRERQCRDCYLRERPHHDDKKKYIVVTVEAWLEAMTCLAQAASNIHPSASNSSCDSWCIAVKRRFGLAGPRRTTRTLHMLTFKATLGTKFWVVLVGTVVANPPPSQRGCRESKRWVRILATFPVDFVSTWCHADCGSWHRAWVDSCCPRRAAQCGGAQRSWDVFVFWATGTHTVPTLGATFCCRG